MVFGWILRVLAKFFGLKNSKISGFTEIGITNVSTLYICTYFSKKMLRDMHTIGTNWKYVNFAQILNCFPSTAHICGSKNVPCGCRQKEKTLFLTVYIVSEKSVILLSSYMRNSLLANIPKIWSKFCCFWLFLAVFEGFVTPLPILQNAQNFWCSTWYTILII